MTSLTPRANTLRFARGQAPAGPYNACGAWLYMGGGYGGVGIAPSGFWHFWEISGSNLQSAEVCPGLVARWAERGLLAHVASSFLARVRLAGRAHRMRGGAAREACWEGAMAGRIAVAMRP
jgi:hypothetical protein